LREDTAAAADEVKGLIQGVTAVSFLSMEHYSIGIYINL